MMTRDYQLLEQKTRDIAYQSNSWHELTQEAHEEHGEELRIILGISELIQEQVRHLQEAVQHRNEDNIRQHVGQVKQEVERLSKLVQSNSRYFDEYYMQNTGENFHKIMFAIEAIENHLT